MIRSRNGMKELIGRAVLLLICLLAVVACGGGGGGSGDGSSSTITSGTLSQGYVKNATIVADKLIVGSLTGNFQLDDGEVTTESDGDGNFSIEIPDNYGAYVLYSYGGFVLDSNGEETPAIPMLAPQGAENISPVTTLVTLIPELEEQIGNNYDADIADPNGVDGAILQLAQTVEAVIEVMTDDQNPLVEGVEAQFDIIEHLAQNLNGKELTEDDVIVEACKEAIVKVLEDDSIIDEEKVTVADATSLADTLETAVQSVVDAIDETTVELEDNTLLAVIEEAVETAADAVESAVEKKLSVKASWLQYRTYPDADSNQYRGWIELQKGYEAAGDEDISQISLLRNGFVVPDFQVVGPYASEGHYSGSYNPVSGKFDFAGPVTYNGYMIKFPSDTELTAGKYVFEITPTGGDVIEHSVVFPEAKDAPLVDQKTMDYEWRGGALELTWQEPDGDFDQFRVVLEDQDGKPLLYVKLPPDQQTVVIPADWVKRLEKIAPVETWTWMVQTRHYSEDGMNYGRGYSGTKTIQPSEDTLWIADAYLQYRTFDNRNNDAYRGWVGLLRGPDTIAETDITDIQVSDSKGTAVETMMHGFYTTEYFAAQYNAESGDLDFSSPLSYSGYSLKIAPSEEGLASSDYLIKVTSSEGEILTRTVTFPEEVELPMVMSDSMNHSWSSGALTLSWGDPWYDEEDGASPEFDKFKVAIFDDSDHTDILYIDVPPDVRTVTIPSDWVDTLKAVKPVENWYWVVQTRMYSDKGMNYSRSYSRTCKIQPEGDATSIYATWQAFQYRTFSDPAANRYQGMLQLNNINGTPIVSSDISNIELLNPSGESVYSGPGMFFRDTALYGNVYENSGLIYDWVLDEYSVLLFKNSDGTVFPAGTYNWKATAADGSLITSGFEFPGQVELPVPDISKFSYEWLADNSLKLNFEMPAGNYDRFRINACDQNGKDLFNIRVKSEDVNTVTLTDWWLEDIYWLSDEARPTTLRVTLQTRSYGADGVEIARGISDAIDIPWQWVNN